MALEVYLSRLGINIIQVSEKNLWVSIAEAP